MKDNHNRISFDAAISSTREAQEWEFIWYFRENRGFSLSFQDFPFHPSWSSEKKNSNYENSNLSLVFSTQSILSINFNTLSFIDFHETHFYTMDCKNSFSPFSFGKSVRSLGVRVLLKIFERREDLAWVFKIFHSIKVCRVRKTFISMKTQTYHLFSQPKAFF